MRTATWIRVLPIVGAVSVPFAIPAAGADPAFPDFDLAVICPPVAAGRAGGVVRVPALVILRTTPPDEIDLGGARAWSIGVRGAGGARVVHATVDGTAGDLAPSGYRQEDGYMKTELTFRSEDAGAVSAVILTFSKETALPSWGEEVLLALEIEAPVPAEGSADYSIQFADGLVGSGQPVKNAIAFGDGITRRDDGGDLDADADSYESCWLHVTMEAAFLRGDVNKDGGVNLSDAVFALDRLFQGGAEFDCADAADPNDDGRLNLSDAAFLLNFLFRGAAPPRPPYPACGFDPTPDDGTPCDRASCP